MRLAALNAPETPYAATSILDGEGFYHISLLLRYLAVHVAGWSPEIEPGFLDGKSQAVEACG